MYFKVREFMTACNQSVCSNINEDYSAFQAKLYLRLITEEYLELLEAFVKNQDLLDLASISLNNIVENIISYRELSLDTKVEIADALSDIVYVVNGLSNVLGINLDNVNEEVHNSNMSKLDSNNKAILNEDGKVMKGPNYFKPDIKKVLSNESFA